MRDQTHEMNTAYLYLIQSLDKVMIRQQFIGGSRIVTNKRRETIIDHVSTIFFFFIET
jgi:hypothetical protein